MQKLSFVSSWIDNQQYAQVAKDDFFSKAEFFIIGYALAHNAMVVTHEKFADSLKKIKIPNVCSGFACIDTFSMLRLLHAKFILL